MRNLLRSARPDLLILIGLGVAVLFLYGRGIGSYSLYDPWEPKYALAVREMRERDDFLTPYLDGKIRWTKPILVYWAMLVPTVVLGDDEASARLPSVVAATAGVLLTYLFVSRLRGRRTGLIAASILATMPQYYYMARQAMPDMLLTLFVGAAMGCFALARFGGGSGQRAMLAFWASLALATLAKGPVAGAVTLLALAPFAALDAGTWVAALRSAPTAWIRETLARYRVVAGLGLFVLIAGPWYGAMLARHGFAFVQSFILDENIQRFQEPLFGHVGTTSYYVNAVIHGQYPWSSLLPLALAFLFFGSRRGLDAEFRLRWYFLCWFAAVFILFTVAGTKLDHYVLPLTVPSAVLLALAWESRLEEPPAPWVRPAFLLSILAAFLPLRDFVFEGNNYLMDVFLPTEYINVLEREIEIVLWVGFGLWAVALAAAALRRSAVAPVVLAVAVAFGHAAYFSQRVVPAHAVERSLKAYADRFAQVHEPDAELVFFGWVRHTLAYYHGRDFRSFDPHQLDALAEFVKDREHVYIVAQTLFFDEMMLRLQRSPATHWSLVSEQHPQFRLVSNSGRTRPGTPRPN